MRVVVIGATGHVGTWLVPLLVEAGHEVTAVSRGSRAPYSPHAAWKQVRSVPIDRAAADADGSFGRKIAALDADVVIDMICFTPKSLGLLVEALRDRAGHLLVTGSIWMHGPSTRVPLREEDALNPFGEYGIDKLAMDRLLQAETRRGGLATTTIVGDPRLTTTVHVSGGTGNQGGIDAFDKMHAPAAFLCGGTTGDSVTDIAGDNCKLDFDYIKTQSVFYGKFKGDHMCSLTPPCRDWLTAAQTGWLRWQLMNDQPLKSMFVGAQCSLCTDPNWTVQTKNLN